MFKAKTTSSIAIANLSEAQKKMHKKYDNTIYLKQLKNFHEMHEAKAKSNHFRRNLLERSKVANYHNEIDRIRGVLSQTNMSHTTKEHLKKREDELKDMINNIS